MKPCAARAVAMRLFLAVLGLLGAIGWQAPRAQEAFAIVVNKANPVTAVSTAELRRIYLKETRTWPNAEPAVPVDWVATSPIREAFSERVLNRSVREMADYWVQQTVTKGLSPPSTQRSARAIL
ncbi:MAG: hypothetical protein FJW23_16815, partial [Acidimicrobiia bacterium]|nr:hypothetical protein [Acidimicrobiia bacterium]